MFDDIILFTHQYPFWFGPTAETYLEEEVWTLSKRAKRIITISFEGFWEEGGTLRDPLPDNLVPILILAADLEPETHYAKRRLAQIRTVLSSEFASELPRIKSKRHAVAFSRYMELSRNIYEIAQKKLLEIDPNIGNGKTLIYSFWFNEPARAAVMLRDSFVKLGKPRAVAVSRAHGYDCYSYRNDLDYLPLQYWVASKLDRVFPCSADGTRYLINKYPKVASSFKTSYLGTKDMGPEASLPSSSHPTCHPTVISCSRLVALKRIDRLAASLALLHNEGIDFEWICIGDGEELDWIKMLVKKLGIEDVTRFTGALSQAEIMREYQTRPANVFVQVSEYEGVPLAIMEAMSAGMPVIATDVGGVSEIVKDNVNGNLVNVEFSDRELADLIKVYFESPQTALSNGARKTWEESFSIKKNSMLFLEECESLLPDS